MRRSVPPRAGGATDATFLRIDRIGMAKFHFVEDYERLVRRLRWKYSLDEAMSRAVGGGGYEHVGGVEAAIVRHCGLRDGQSLVDLGCGSGRLPAALGKQVSIDYCGIDVVKALLDYARKKAPANYRFILNRSLSVPLPEASFDMASAFSLFTHLLHHESYIYLQELRRVVRPGGQVVFSFLEFSGTGPLGSVRGHGRGATQRQIAASEPVHGAIADRAVGGKARLCASAIHRQYRRALATRRSAGTKRCHPGPVARVTGQRPAMRRRMDGRLVHPVDGR